MQYQHRKKISTAHELQWVDLAEKFPKVLNTLEKSLKFIKASMARGQGDQIGRNFAIWATF